MSQLLKKLFSRLTTYVFQSHFFTAVLLISSIHLTTFNLHNVILFFKKLLNKTDLDKEKVFNIELIDKLIKVTDIENLEQLLFSPVAKIYLLNVYNDTFDDFLSNMLIKNNSRNIISVNIYSYFKDKREIKYKFKRLIPVLKSNKINIKMECELTELINTIKYMKDLEDKNAK